MKHFYFIFLLINISIIYGQPILIKEIIKGPLDGINYGSKIIPANGKLFFPGIDFVIGEEPFLFDPVTNNYSILNDINVGPGSSNPKNYTVFKNYILFFASDSNGDGEPYIINTITLETKILKNINPMSSSVYDNFETIVSNDGIYFIADNGLNGKELWFTNCTESGTRMIKDIAIGSSNSSPRRFSYNVKLNKILFTAYTDQTGEEYYISDGTENGTKILKDIRLGDFSGSGNFSIASGNYFFFDARSDPNIGFQIWVSDGTESGTKVIRYLGDTESNPYALIPYQNKCLFFANMTKMYVTDGTDAGTIFLKNIIPYPISGGFEKILSWTELNNKIYFSGDQDLSGFNKELFETDGTPSGTLLVKEINPTGNSFAMNFHNFRNKIYFSASGKGSNEELWVSDGTLNGTKLESEIYAGFQSSTPGSFATLDSCIYFAANDEFKGRELYVLCPLIETKTNDPLFSNKTFCTLFPNPVYDHFTLSNLEQISKVQLINLDGKIIKNWNNNLDMFDLKALNLKKGNYLIYVYSKNSMINVFPVNIGI